MTKALVYGKGESGKGAAKLLNSLGREVVLYSDEEGASCPVSILDGVDLVVISPSVRPDCKLCREATARGAEVIGEIELGYRHSLADIIAVTGTNGKTTTVSLITRLLKNSCISARAMGNIGVSFAGNALSLKQDDVAVLELSSFQLMSIKDFRAKIAVCLNVTADHIEYHKTMTEYIKAKRNILVNSTASDYAVLNYDDPCVRRFGEHTNAKAIYYSLYDRVNGAYAECGKIKYNGNTVCALSDVYMLGEHNLSNALAAVTVGKILNIPDSVIERTLREFLPPAHRIQFVREAGGKRYYNDSKGTNADAALHACRSMQGRTALIMGGYDKGLDYTDFFRSLPVKVNTVILYGENKTKLIEQAKCVETLAVIVADDIPDAVKISERLSCENVLLSPATSSFDSYSGYAERGEHFIQAVKNIDV